VPQTKKLNRGIWKKWETSIRDESQNKPLIIIAGNIYSSNKTLGKNNIGVPDYCYKIVLDSNTKEVMHCLLFPNDNSNSFTEMPLDELKTKLGYDLMP
jgi:DNA/RNA endonuclease G (NUC1)